MQIGNPVTNPVTWVVGQIGATEAIGSTPAEDISTTTDRRAAVAAHWHGRGAGRRLGAAGTIRARAAPTS